MKLIKLFLWFYYAIIDKIFLLITIGKKRDELNNAKLVKDTGKIQEIWATLINEDFPVKQDEIFKVYLLNFTVCFENVYKRIQFYIKNRFWSLLNFHYIDTWNLSNEDIFLRPGLMIYAAIKKDKKISIIIAKISNQKFTLLDLYEVKKIPLWKMNNRQIVFTEEEGFFAI